VEKALRYFEVELITQSIDYSMGAPLGSGSAIRVDTGGTPWRKLKLPISKG